MEEWEFALSLRTDMGIFAFVNLLIAEGKRGIGGFPLHGVIQALEV